MSSAEKTRGWLFGILALMLALGALSVSGYAAQDPIELADTYMPKLKTMLMDNIASFWLAKAPDYQHGGYTIDIGPHGEVKAGVEAMMAGK